MQTEREKAHLKKCKEGHFSTKPFEASDRKLLVCEKTGQYVDLDALGEEINKAHATMSRRD